MYVHVVSAVVVHGSAALGALQEIAGLGGNPARGMVACRVVQFQAVETDLVESPGGERHQGARGDTGAADRREHPVADAADAVVEVQAPQRDPAEDLPAPACDSPVAALLLLPVLAVCLEPFPDLGLSGGSARVPAAGLAILVGGEKDATPVGTAAVSGRAVKGTKPTKPWNPVTSYGIAPW